jgi:serine/threonine-protein kinase
VALVALLALVGAIVAPLLFGDQRADVSGQGGQNPDGSARGGESRQQPSQQASPVQAGDGLTEEAAAQTVRNVYTIAAEGDYGASYDLLSKQFKQSVAPTQAEWGGQFNTLESIRFERGLDAQVSGNAATVTGVTIAEHTDRTERNTASWTLVNEGGEWRLNDINIQQRELM